MVDTYVSDAYAARCEGSSPFLGTKENKEISSEKMGFFILFVHIRKRDLKP